jgi:hypothetical protein
MTMDSKIPRPYVSSVLAVLATVGGCSDDGATSISDTDTQAGTYSGTTLGSTTAPGTDAGSSSSSGSDSDGTSTGPEVDDGGESFRILYEADGRIFARDVIEGELAQPVVLLEGAWSLRDEQAGFLTAISNDAIAIVDPSTPGPEVKGLIDLPLVDATVFVAAITTETGSRWRISSFVPGEPSQLHVFDMDESGPGELRRVDAGLSPGLVDTRFVRGGSHMVFAQLEPPLGSSGLWVVSAVGDAEPVAIPLAEPEETWAIPTGTPVLDGDDGQASVLVYMQGDGPDSRAYARTYAVDLGASPLVPAPIGRLDQAAWVDSATMVVRPDGRGLVTVQGAPGDAVDLAWLAFDGGRPSQPVQLSTGPTEGRVAREPVHVPLRPTWSPDGAWLLFGVHDDAYRLFAIRWTDGLPSEPVWVVDDASVTGAAFTPASDALFFVRTADGSQQLLRATIDDRGLQPAEQLAEGDIRWYVAADDGETIVYGDDDDRVWFVAYDEAEGLVPPQALDPCQGDLAGAALSPGGTFVVCWFVPPGASLADSVYRLVEPATLESYEFELGTRGVHMVGLSPG